MSRRDLTRRDLLTGVAGAAVVSLPGTTTAAPRPRSFRFVHMTDLHMRTANGAPEGIRLAVQKVRALRPRPDFVITGGDTAEGLMTVDAGRANELLSLVEEALRPLEIPVHHVVGNHDVFGWGRTDAVFREANYGKAMYAERFIKGPTYRSFDHGGWHFVLLDSIQPAREPKPGGWPYEGRIDDDQLTWLKADLEKNGKRPVIVVTHVPMLSTYHAFFDGSYATPQYRMMMTNGKELHELLLPHPVKVVLQGHTHIRENCLYAGRQHITSGAVCGDWWNGPRLGIDPEGFSVLDVGPNEVEWRYVPTGWKARNA